jgi:hypothetical protein
MALKFKIAKLEDVEESLRGLYVKTADGTYVLEVDGASDNDRIKEFRERNIELLKEAEKYKDLNPEKYAQLMETQRLREEKELIDKGEVDKVIEGRVAAMKKEHQAAIDNLSNSNGQMTRQLESLLIDNTVRTAATKTGVRPEAVDDVLLRAKTVFSIKDGKVAALDSDGKVMYGKDGTTPLGIEEWSTGLKAVASHLYLGSNGSGANNGFNNNSGGGSNAKLKGVQKISASLDDANYD